MTSRTCSTVLLLLLLLHHMHLPGAASAVVLSETELLHGSTRTTLAAPVRSTVSQATRDTNKAENQDADGPACDSRRKGPCGSSALSTPTVPALSHVTTSITASATSTTPVVSTTTSTTSVVSTTTSSTPVVSTASSPTAATSTAASSTRVTSTAGSPMSVASIASRSTPVASTAMRSTPVASTGARSTSVQYTAARSTPVASSSIPVAFATASSTQAASTLTSSTSVKAPVEVSRLVDTANAKDSAPITTAAITNESTSNAALDKSSAQVATAKHSTSNTASDKRFPTAAPMGTVTASTTAPAAAAIERQPSGGRPVAEPGGDGNKASPSGSGSAVTPTPAPTMSMFNLAENLISGFAVMVLQSQVHVEEPGAVDKHDPSKDANMLDDLVYKPEPLQFVTPNNTVVTAQRGTTTYLPCVVKNIADGLVTWLRRRDHHLLTVARGGYAQDDRFQVVHDQHPEDWSMQLKYVADRDAGRYECQVSSHPPVSIFIHLKVVEAVCVIEGPAEKFVRAGSQLRLTCHIEHCTTEPEFMFWYKDGIMVNFDVQKVYKVTVDLPNNTTVIVVDRASRGHSGNYTCEAAQARAASNYVHVINGENPAAMQTGGGTVGRPLLVLLALQALLQRIALG